MADGIGIYCTYLPKNEAYNKDSLQLILDPLRTIFTKVGFQPIVTINDSDTAFMLAYQMLQYRAFNNRQIRIVARFSGDQILAAPARFPENQTDYNGNERHLVMFKKCLLLMRNMTPTQDPRALWRAISQGIMQSRIIVQLCDSDSVQMQMFTDCAKHVVVMGTSKDELSVSMSTIEAQVSTVQAVHVPVAHPQTNGRTNDEDEVIVPTLGLDENMDFVEMDEKQQADKKRKSPSPITFDMLTKSPSNGIEVRPKFVLFTAQSVFGHCYPAVITMADGNDYKSVDAYVTSQNAKNGGSSTQEDYTQWYTDATKAKFETEPFVSIIVDTPGPLLSVDGVRASDEQNGIQDTDVFKMDHKELERKYTSEYKKTDSHGVLLTTIRRYLQRERQSEPKRRKKSVK